MSGRWMHCLVFASKFVHFKSWYTIPFNDLPSYDYLWFAKAEELMLALDKVHMEAARMEWCNELVLSSLLHHKQFIGVPKSMRGDKQGIDIAWWNRQQVCKNLYAASTAIRQATEELQVSTHWFGFVCLRQHLSVDCRPWNNFQHTCLSANWILCCQL